MLGEQASRAGRLGGRDGRGGFVRSVRQVDSQTDRQSVSQSVSERESVNRGLSPLAKGEEPKETWE